MANSSKNRKEEEDRSTSADEAETETVNPWERRLGMYSLLALIAYGYLRFNRTRKGFESFRNIGGYDSGSASGGGILAFLTHHPGLLLRVIPGVLLFGFVALQMRKKLFKTKVNKDGKRFQTSLLVSMLTSVATHALDEIKPSGLSSSSGSGIIDKVKLLMESASMLGVGVPLLPFLLKSKRTKHYIFRHGLSLLAYVPLVARFAKKGLWTMLTSSNKSGDLVGTLFNEAPFAASCFGHHISALLLGDTQLSKKNRFVSYLGWLAMFAGRGVLDWIPWGMFGGGESHSIVKVALQGLGYFAFAHATPMVWTAVDKIAKGAKNTGSDKKDA